MKKDLKLKKGEVICPECDGIGWIDEVLPKKGCDGSTMCSRCKGRGKLDWVQMVMIKSTSFEIFMKTELPEIISRINNNL